MRFHITGTVIRATEDGVVLDLPIFPVYISNIQELRIMDEDNSTSRPLTNQEQYDLESAFAEFTNLRLARAMVQYMKREY